MWCELHEEAFAHFGGTPERIRLDNLKEGVIEPDIYDPELNKLYAALLDIDAGPRIEVPAARTGTEAGRTTKPVKLRLRPEDALRLRAAAREAGVELSEYVARLLDDPQRAAVARAPVSSLPLADVSRLAGVLGALPEEVRRARGELGRAFGLVKHLFEMPATALNAERHAFELSETTRDARTAIANVDASIDRLLNELASIREDLATAARRLARSA